MNKPMNTSSTLLTLGDSSQTGKNSADSTRPVPLEVRNIVLAEISVLIATGLATEFRIESSGAVVLLYSYLISHVVLVALWLSWGKAKLWLRLSLAVAVLEFGGYTTIVFSYVVLTMTAICVPYATLRALGWLTLCKAGDRNVGSQKLQGWQFSLSGIFFAVLIAAVLMAWFRLRIEWFDIFMYDETNLPLLFLGLVAYGGCLNAIVLMTTWTILGRRPAWPIRYIIFGGGNVALALVLSQFDDGTSSLLILFNLYLSIPLVILRRAGYLLRFGGPRGDSR